MPDDPFVVAVDTWVAKAKKNQDLAVQAIAQAALARVKELTPVKTGYLRANWTVIKGGTASVIVTPEATDRNAESLLAVLSLRAGDTFTLVNPVVYAMRIENGFVGIDSRGRHYEQEGVHMLQQTITELPTIAQKAVQDLQR